MKARALILLGAMMTTGTTATALPVPPPYMAPKKANAEQINQTYRNKLQALRGEVIETQARDGGMLTEAHRAELQDKLDRIHAGFRREVRDVDVFSVSADGRRRR
ncbi:hypothetical protein KNJ79_08060 [Sphingopyxis indica]|uniref:hypothetical protein n=1 Tax=Sphingopyxis indica TaxID=436663 RepID=UPI002938D94C|nr:hypothetical protein [Sphingopyxis indica]WOF44829.1 hypothetical protein KNJ79_08060 [Sphingopyxis indica]